MASKPHIHIIEPPIFLVFDKEKKQVVNFWSDPLTPLCQVMCACVASNFQTEKE